MPSLPNDQNPHAITTKRELSNHIPLHSRLGSPGGLHCCKQAALVLNLLVFPSHPPQMNCSQSLVCLLKPQRGKLPAQEPWSIARLHWSDGWKKLMSYLQEDFCFDLATLVFKFYGDRTNSLLDFKNSRISACTLIL